MAGRKKVAGYTVEEWPVEKVVPYERNPRIITDAAVAKVAESIRAYGFRQPLVVDGDGVLVVGHTRREAAKRLGIKMVPVHVATGLTPDQIRGYRIADNRTNEESGWDDDLLAAEIMDLAETGFDLAALAFNDDEIEKFLVSDAGADGDDNAEAERAEKIERTLAERFGVPPFTVLDARQGYWQERKRAWIGRGIRSELGRSDVLFNADSQGRLKDIMAQRKSGGVLFKNKELGRKLTTEEFQAEHCVADEPGWTSGTSIFDPVLCEIAYRWFCPAGGEILDPFAGGSVRGVVAAWLGRKYTGIDLREEQCTANAEQLDAMGDVPGSCKWIAGDSTDMDSLLPEGYEADFVFTCPPYGDLEVYSGDPLDLSNMDAGAFDDAYASILSGAVGRLRDDRFACVVVGDYRDGKGLMSNFVSKTIACMEDAGAALYNEAVLITMVGSLPVRVGRQFLAGRKLGKGHQNVLVFVKGDPARAVKALGEVEFADPVDDAADDMAGLEHA